MAIVAACGLAAEARIARRAGLAAIVLASSEAQRNAALERALANGVHSLLSFGIAGGLDPTLPPGAILVPEAVRIGDETIRCSEGLFSRPAMHGIVLAPHAIVAAATEKRALFARTGALAADLESGVVARAARRAAIPFAVLRAIADPAWRDLPPAALIGLDGQGRPRPAAVARSLAAAPGQIPALIALALDTRRALRSLAYAAAAMLARDSA